VDHGGDLTVPQLPIQLCPSVQEEQALDPYHLRRDEAARAIIIATAMVCDHIIM
jgi:hypothetical protein